MALFDNNSLLSALGGQPLTPDATQEQLQNLRNYGNAALGAQLPQTIYSPWQGVAYLLDKFQGRNALDSAANIQKQAIIDKFKEQPTPNDFAQQAPIQPTSGFLPQTSAPAPILQQANNPQPTAPQLKGTITEGIGGSGGATTQGAAKIVIQSPEGQQSIVTPDQIGEGLPDGYKAVATIDNEGNETPISSGQAPIQSTPQTIPQSPVAQPQQIAQNIPQTTGSVPNSEQRLGQPVETQFGQLPPVMPPLSGPEAYHRAQLPKDQQEAFDAYRQGQWTPKLIDLGGLGTLWVMPNGQHGIYSTPKVSSIEAGGAKAPSVLQVDPQTGKPILNTANGVGGETTEQTLRHLGAVGGDITANNAAKTTAYTKGTEAQQAPIMEALSQSVNAQRQGSAYKLIEQLDSIPATANLHSGPYAKEWLDLQKTINDLYPGQFDTSSIASGEALNKLVAPLASLNAKELTNRPTQFDFQTFINSNPGIENSPQGRKVLLSIFKAQNQRDIELGRIANQYIKNPDGYNDALIKFYKDNPINVQYNGKTFSFEYGKPMTVNGKAVGSTEEFSKEAQTANSNANTKKSWKNVNGRLVWQ